MFGSWPCQCTTIIPTPHSLPQPPTRFDSEEPGSTEDSFCHTRNDQVRPNEKNEKWPFSTCDHSQGLVNVVTWEEVHFCYIPHGVKCYYNGARVFRCACALRSLCLGLSTSNTFQSIFQSILQCTVQSTVASRVHAAFALTPNLGALDTSLHSYMSCCSAGWAHRSHDDLPPRAISVLLMQYHVQKKTTACVFNNVCAE